MVKNKQAKMEVSGGRRLLANKIFSGPDPIGRQKAKAEFNMTPDTTRQYIQELKLYLKQHTKLPDHIVGGECANVYARKVKMFVIYR